MAATRSIYRGYVLNCRPTRVDDGYQARAASRAKSLPYWLLPPRNGLQAELASLRIGALGIVFDDNPQVPMQIIEHNGHTITLDVADRGKGWTWTYQIDSGPVIANKGAPHPSEVLARLEAMAVAQREVDSAAQ